MNRAFAEHYQPSKKEFQTLWKEGLIVPDANVLLNLYRYSEATRSQFLTLFRRFQARLWLPHRAGEEFHRGRLTVIPDQKEHYDSLLADFLAVLARLNTRRHPSVSTKLARNLQRVSRDLEAEFKRTVASLAIIPGDDPILDEVTELFSGRVGDALAAGDLDKLTTEAEARYEKRIPPGFKDAKKPLDERYGDYIIWEQLLREATSKKAGVIFVTDDSKDDWWLRTKGGKTVGPLPALRREFAERVGAPFYMYQADRFMEYAGDYLGTQVEKEAIKEVRETRAQVVPGGPSGHPAASYYAKILAADPSWLGATRALSDWQTLFARNLDTLRLPELTRIAEQEKSIAASLAPLRVLQEEMRQLNILLFCSPPN